MTSVDKCRVIWSVAPVSKIQGILVVMLEALPAAKLWSKSSSRSAKFACSFQEVVVVDFSIAAQTAWR